MKDKDQKSLEALYESMDEEFLVSWDKHGNAVWRNKKGYLHRLSGPALVYLDGDDHEWWIDGTEFTEEEFNNHPLVKAYRLKQKMKDRSTTEEEGVMADMFI